jgi:hypothetical protein
MAILHVVETRTPYLIQINIDHYSLKYLLEQWLCAPEQHKRVIEMLGRDYEIIYKKGKENFVPNALSKQFDEDGSLLDLSLPSLG